MKWLEWFLGSNSLSARLLRTIVESVFGFLVANIDILFKDFAIPPEYKLVIMGVIVAVISPVLASLKKGDSANDVQRKTPETQ